MQASASLFIACDHSADLFFGDASNAWLENSHADHVGRHRAIPVGVTNKRAKQGF